MKVLKILSRHGQTSLKAAFSQSILCDGNTLGSQVELVNLPPCDFKTSQKKKKNTKKAPNNKTNRQTNKKWRGRGRKRRESGKENIRRGGKTREKFFASRVNKLTWTSHQRFTLYVNKRTEIEAKKNPHSPQALTLNIFTHILKLNSIRQFSAISVMAETLKHALTANENTPLSMHRCDLATQGFFSRTF